MKNYLACCVWLLSLFCLQKAVAQEAVTLEVAQQRLLELGFVSNNILSAEDFISEAEKGNAEVVKLFLEAGRDPNATDARQRYALLTATDQGHVTVVEVLIEAKVDLEVRDQFGRTAFVIATMRKHLDVLELLLRAKEQG